MNHMRNFAAVWLSIALTLFYLVGYYLVGFTSSKFIVDLTALAFLTFISVSTIQPAFKGLIAGLNTSVDKFIFSYWSIWTLALIHRIWIIIVGLTDKPDSQNLHDALAQSFIPGLIGLGFAIAAGHGIAAPLTGTDKLQRREIITIVIASVISGTVLGIAIGVFVIAGWVNQ